MEENQIGFKILMDIIPGLKEYEEGQRGIAQVLNFKDLHLDVIGKGDNTMRIALFRYHTKNSLVIDFSMEILVNFNSGTVEPLIYEDLNYRRDVSQVNNKGQEMLKRNLTILLVNWLISLQQQGFRVQRKERQA